VAERKCQGRTMHNPQPSHPKKLSFSLRNMEESIAQTTTERAPRGVYTSQHNALSGMKYIYIEVDNLERTTTRASMNAYAVEFCKRRFCCGIWSHTNQQNYTVRPESSLSLLSTTEKRTAWINNPTSHSYPP